MNVCLTASDFAYIEYANPGHTSATVWKAIRPSQPHQNSQNYGKVFGERSRSQRHSMIRFATDRAGAGVRLGLGVTAQDRLIQACKMAHAKTPRRKEWKI
jgi:hypothetical protein